MQPAADRLVYIAFAVNCLLAGANSVAIRFSNRELDPLWGATVRFGLAAAALIAAMRVLRLRFPSGAALRGVASYGLLQFAGGFGLTYYALVRIHAGLGQTILALVPLATLLLAVAQRQERFDATASVGTVVSLVGVAVVTQTSAAGDVGLPSVLAVLGAVVCFAQALIVVRRHREIHPVTMNAGAMAVGAATLLIASAVARESWTLPTRPETWFAVGYVAVVGSVVVFLLVVFVTQRWGATRSSYLMVVIPVVSVLLSAWLDDEPLRGGLFVGGAAIIGGVYLGALRTREPAPV